MTRQYEVTVWEAFRYSENTFRFFSDVFLGSIAAIDRKRLAEFNKAQPRIKISPRVLGGPVPCKPGWPCPFPKPDQEVEWTADLNDKLDAFKSEIDAIFIQAKKHIDLVKNHGVEKNFEFHITQLPVPPLDDF